MDSYNSLEEYKNNKKYTCIKCGTLIKNISNGCPKCNCHEYRETNYDSRYENMLRDNNLFASLLFVIAWLTIALGFIFGIVMGGETDEFDFIITLQYWAISDICAIIFFSLSEIIRILHDIRYKIWLK